MKNIIDLQANVKAIESLAEVETSQLPPAGYMLVELSTKGRVFAPAKFHIRNFNTRDLLALALTEEDNLQERLIIMLQEMIFEDVDVASFHENEVIETLVRLYIAYFSPVLLEVPFPLEDGEGTPEQRKLLEEGKWKPVTDINLIEGTATFDIPEEFNPRVPIVNHRTGFSAVFGLPHYGDVVVLKRWMSQMFGADDKRFFVLGKKIELRERMLADFYAQNPVNLDNLPAIDADMEDEYNAFNLLKTTTLVDAVRALHLIEFDGEPVGDLQLHERVALVQDPRMDVNIAKKLDEDFSAIKIGIKPEVQMLNPITNAVCSRRYSFRLFDILQAIQLSANNDYADAISSDNIPEPVGP